MHICFVPGDGVLAPSTQPPTWRTSVSLFVWVLSFDLSGKGGPTSSYATAGIRSSIDHCTTQASLPGKRCLLQGGDTSRRRKRKTEENLVKGIRKSMNERNLNEVQWEDRKQWSLGVGQRRTTF